MGQRDVYEFLKANEGSWFCAGDLCEKLGVTIGAVTASLRKLRRFREVRSRRDGRKTYFSYTRQDA